MEFVLLLVTSLLTTIAALTRRSWVLMAVAAVLALPFAIIAHVTLLLPLLLPCLQLAAAVALRWQVEAVGWLALLLAALAVWLASGPGSLIVSSEVSLFWVLLAGLLAGFVALAWDRPPWVAAKHGRSGDRGS